MPFKSCAQRKFLFLKHPKIAEEFAKETPKGKKLPEYVHKSEDDEISQNSPNTGYQTTSTSVDSEEDSEKQSSEYLIYDFDNGSTINKDGTPNIDGKINKETFPSKLWALDFANKLKTMGKLNRFKIVPLNDYLNRRAKHNLDFNEENGEEYEQQPGISGETTEEDSQETISFQEFCQLSREDILKEAKKAKSTHYIKKHGSTWKLIKKGSGKTLGTHPSKAKALAQLRAIEFSKHG